LPSNYVIRIMQCQRPDSLIILSSSFAIRKRVAGVTGKYVRLTYLRSAAARRPASNITNTR
jgi:hypothetical protein